MAVALDNVQQGAALTVRHIGQPYPLLSTGDVLIILLKEGYEFINKGTALGIEHLASLCHLLFPKL